MTFQGLTDNYDATLTVDWAEVHKTQGFDAGGSIYYIGADVEVMFDDLHRRHAIDLKSSGGDDVMERYLDVVYARLLDLLFRPIEPEKVPADKRGGLMDALGSLIDPKDGALSSRQTTGFGLSVGYQLKDLKTDRHERPDLQSSRRRPAAQLRDAQRRRVVRPLRQRPGVLQDGQYPRPGVPGPRDPRRRGRRAASRLRSGTSTTWQ